MYITASEYSEITDRPQEEATIGRIRRASQLLDARIGNHAPNWKTGFKLDLKSLPAVQQNAVKEWVAQMVIYFHENNDAAPSAASVSLGRFSVTNPGQQGKVLPEQLNLADAILVNSGLVRRGVSVVGCSEVLGEENIGARVGERFK